MVRGSSEENRCSLTEFDGPYAYRTLKNNVRRSPGTSES